jgi:hypothetical protein
VYKKEADNTNVQNKKKQGSGKRDNKFIPPPQKKVFPIGKSGENVATAYSSLGSRYR